jgi:hypothetical protein
MMEAAVIQVLDGDIRTREVLGRRRLHVIHTSKKLTSRLCGRTDFDMIAEIFGSVRELGCELSGISAGKIFGTEITIARARSAAYDQDRRNKRVPGEL